MNLSQVCLILVFILPLVVLEKKALENHIDDEPVDSEKAKELKRRKSSDLKIKKELARAKAFNITTETEVNNPTTIAPSTTGKVRRCISGFLNILLLQKAFQSHRICHIALLVSKGVYQIHFEREIWDITLEWSLGAKMCWGRIADRSFEQIFSAIIQVLTFTQ